MRRGDYGYDAPYALVLFGCLSAAGAIIAATSWWQGLHREAVLGTIYFVFFFGNAASFLYTDIRATRIYEQALRTLGASNIERRGLGWRFWWGNPIAATTLLIASKAPA